ncbi:hypothetical protein [Crocosphaera sp. XPORK-15E]|uniref:hypothetical protein n=1 Tax=Crocosphaera sp. XPORK-15E TaxID=3110247 RepID=UPI002B1EC3EC|nr:hypothetical protein [Crocosphaera sp. XPORK-15E]MEA5534179.1 hypothetical protein [Crocosphaera sp. XPORK-15E]
MTLSRSSFRISPLIQVTLISLYVSLTIPLPFLAKVTDSSVSPLILWTGIILGLLLLIGALSERVVVDETQIKVTYPVWFPSFFRQGWSLNWQEIKDLKLRTTGQGGLVYYFISENSEKAYLLPMRIAGFSYLVKIVTEKTGIDTTDIRPLSQPWMYLILLVVTLFLLLMDSWTIWTAMMLK